MGRLAAAPLASVVSKAKTDYGTLSTAAPPFRESNESGYLHTVKKIAGVYANMTADG